LAPKNGSAAGDVKTGLVMTTYNHAKDLERALDSLDGQTVKPDCAYVFNDGSSDHTSAVIRGWSGRTKMEHYVRTKPDSGYDLAGALDNVIEGLDCLFNEKHCGWAFILDDDVVLKEDGLECLYRRASESRSLFASGKVGEENLGFREGYSILSSSHWKRHRREFAANPFSVYTILRYRAEMQDRLGYFPDCGSGSTRKSGSGYDAMYYYHTGRVMKHVGHSFLYTCLRFAYRRPGHLYDVMRGYRSFGICDDSMSDLRRYARRREIKKLCPFRKRSFG